MKRKTTASTLTATALAALGLANLSPAQWVAAGVVLSAGMVATPALASIAIPGVGVIIKKKPGNAPIVAPTEANGVIQLIGLEPGDYELSLIGEERVTMVAVGRDGILTSRAVAEDDGSGRHVEALRITAAAPMRNTAFNIRALFGSDFLLVAVPGRSQRPADPVAPKMRFIDINRSSAGDIVRLAPATSAEAAEFIVAERAKSGAFKDPIDFAQRVCPRVSVDFDLAPTRIGNALIVAKGTDPVKFGFKCAAQRAGAAPVLSIYNVSYSYVGHVTLLR
ncbi:MAG: hypothetical protein LH610_01575 [Sphingomonas bacterium]|nr:hypothetical protein [Sphingomonas bacterium]